MSTSSCASTRLDSTVGSSPWGRKGLVAPAAATDSVALTTTIAAITAVRVSS
jgi:hypothetical protein